MSRNCRKIKDPIILCVPFEKLPILSYPLDIVPRKFFASIDPVIRRNTRKIKKRRIFKRFVPRFFLQKKKRYEIKRFDRVQNFEHTDIETDFRLVLSIIMSIRINTFCFLDSLEVSKFQRRREKSIGPAFSVSRSIRNLRCEFFTFPYLYSRFQFQSGRTATGRPRAPAVGNPVSPSRSIDRSIAYWAISLHGVAKKFGYRARSRLLLRGTTFRIRVAADFL